MRRICRLGGSQYSSHIIGIGKNLTFELVQNEYYEKQIESFGLILFLVHSQDCWCISSRDLPGYTLWNLRS